MDAAFPIDPEASLDEANPKDGRAFRWSLPRFFVSRYPVTVGQWRVFREDVRHERWVPRRTDGSAIAEEDFNPDAERGPLGWPVVHVSWYEALAYCWWLTERLRHHTATPDPLATLLREGDATSGGRPWAITLPSEAEWERTARGTQDLRRRPWDDQLDFDLTLANGATRLTFEEWVKFHGLYDAEALQERNVLGAYPSGVSPCGAHEVVGNVWEWTRSKWVEYPYRPDYSGVEREQLLDAAKPGRVVRGGSFGIGRWSLRCAYRGYDRPDAHVDDHGFRVVASPFNTLVTTLEHLDG